MIKKKEAKNHVLASNLLDDDFSEEVVLEDEVSNEVEDDFLDIEEGNPSISNDDILDLEIIEIQSIQDGIYPAVIKGTSLISNGKIKITFVIPVSDDEEEEVYLYVERKCKRTDILFRLKRCIDRNLTNFSQLIGNEVWISIKNNDDGTNVYTNIIDVLNIDEDEPTVNEKGYFKK